MSGVKKLCILYYGVCYPVKELLTYIRALEQYVFMH